MSARLSEQIVYIQLSKAPRSEFQLMLVQMLMADSKVYVFLTEDPSILGINTMGLTRAEAKAGMLALIRNLVHTGYLRLNGGSPADLVTVVGRR